jgi:hypothetical protein
MIWEVGEKALDRVYLCEVFRPIIEGPSITMTGALWKSRDQYDPLE